MPSTPEHWNRVYRARGETSLTWFEADPVQSLALIRTYTRPDDAVLDVGGGASRLVDGLLAAGYDDLSVLDMSEAALDISRARLGAAAGKVRWIVADITRWQPQRTVALWHDRAVFHFLTRPADRASYGGAMLEALVPGGHAIIASFALDGPETCSGLPVVRYSADTLAATLEGLAPGQFARVESAAHDHVTPKGNRQPFQISVFRRN